MENGFVIEPVLIAAQRHKEQVELPDLLMLELVGLPRQHEAVRSMKEQGEASLTMMGAMILELDQFQGNGLFASMIKVKSALQMLRELKFGRVIIH